MNLLPDILHQAADRIAAHRGAAHATSEPAHARLAEQPSLSPPRRGRARSREPVAHRPLDDEAALTSLVLYEAAIKLAYMGHCGRPGKRGGSRPKNQCGALPLRAAGAGEVTRNSQSPNAYTVERSVQKKRGKPDERVTRVIYEKRRNPEEQRTWLKDAGIDLGRAAINTLPAALLGLGLYAAGKNVSVGLRSGLLNVGGDLRRATATPTPDPIPDVPSPRPSGQDSAPAPTPGPGNGKGKTNGGLTRNGAIKNAPEGAPLTREPIKVIPITPTQATSTSSGRRRGSSVNTLDRASEGVGAGPSRPGTSLPVNRPKTSPKKAFDELDTMIADMKTQHKGIWTVTARHKPNKGTQEYEVTLRNKTGREQRLQWAYDAKSRKWGWRKKS